MIETATSQIEKHFLISSVYRRGRRYFDIQKLNNLEHQQQIERRSPLPTKQTIDTRVSDSFICSNDLLCGKVSNDLSYFHSKLDQEEADETETTYTTHTKKAKTIDMRKMLSRSEVSKQRHVHLNQQQFNNFTFTKHKPRKSLDFNSYISRGKGGSKTGRYRNPQKEELAGDKVGKMYEHCLFDQSHYRCFVDFQKNGKTQPIREDEVQPIYEPAKVKRGEQLTKKSPGHLAQFFHGNGKADPSQLDNRILKENQYFWKSVRQERDRLKDYSIAKRKEDEVLNRLNKILEKRKVVDDRTEMCDEKYFRRQPGL